jgi:hypothetical protein
VHRVSTYGQSMAARLAALTPAPPLDAMSRMTTYLYHWLRLRQRGVVSQFENNPITPKVHDYHERGILVGMPETSYRVIPQKGHLFSVEMTLPSGRRRLIPDFRAKAEADAWIVQTERLLHKLDPRHKLISRDTGKH